MNIIGLETYIFGSARTVVVRTGCSFEEVENDFQLREDLIIEAFREDMHVQSTIELLTS